jgi:flavin-binding protein dodecin
MVTIEIKGSDYTKMIELTITTKQSMEELISEMIYNHEETVKQAIAAELMINEEFL